MKKPIYEHGKLHVLADVPSRHAACIRSSGLYQISPVSNLDSKPMAFLDLSHFSSISPVILSCPLWCHLGPHARGSPTSLGKVAAGHQWPVSTWVDGWATQLLDAKPSQTDGLLRAQRKGKYRKIPFLFLYFGGEGDL